MTEQEAFELMKWCTAQNKKIQLEIWKKFGAIDQQEAEQLRKKFLHSIKEIKTLIQKDRRKFLDRDLQPLAETTRLRILSVKQKPRRKPKKGTLLKRVKHHLKLIDQLRGEGLGWRKTAEYLRRYAGVQISHNQLRLLYQKLKEELEPEKAEPEIIRTQDPNVIIRKR